MCIRPLRATIPKPGSRPVLCSIGELNIPCQTCHECIKKRSAEMATRAVHELSYHKENCFLNLTYNPENVPDVKDFYLEKRSFKLFLKRLRKKYSTKTIKYLSSHEYGGKTKRPHHHLLIFGHSFSNWKKYGPPTKSGHQLYTSSELTDLWTYGDHKLGTATGGSAYYIASYALKSRHHDFTDPQSGELLYLKDKMTASQSLGYQYLVDNQYRLMEYPQLPRYYRKILQERWELQNMYDLHKQFPKKYGFSEKALNRLKKLIDINPTLHEHYTQKMAENALTIIPRTDHNHLASLEINKTQNKEDSEFRSKQSTIDKLTYETEHKRLSENLTKDKK